MIRSGEGRKSVAIHLSLQVPDRTLSDDDAAIVRDRVVAALAEAVRRRVARLKSDFGPPHVGVSMTRFRLAVAIGVAALVLVGTVGAAGTQLNGSVGPGFSISLRDGSGAQVTHLDAGSVHADCRRQVG